MTTEPQQSNCCQKESKREAMVENRARRMKTFESFRRGKFGGHSGMLPRLVFNFIYRCKTTSISFGIVWQLILAGIMIA